MLVVRKLPNYQNLAVSYQLTDVGKGESVLGVAMNLLMSDRRGALMHEYMSRIIVSLLKPATL